MNKLESKIDGTLCQVSDFKVITVGGFAGLFNEYTGEFTTNDVYEFHNESEASAKFDELKASGKYHTVTAWAYENGPNYEGQQIYFEIDTFSNLNAEYYQD